jgi:internalin A
MKVPVSANVAAITPAPEPPTKTKYCISYAWGDSTPEGVKREKFVDDFCTKAEARRIEVRRDKTAMSYGNRISKFMREIGKGDLIFIVLSDKYLKSAYCMHELCDVWRNCKEDPDAFIAKTRVFILPCAKIATLRQRTQYIVRWKKRFEETEALVKKFGPAILGSADLDDYRWMSDFVNKTPDMLRLVLDVLRPRDFDEFVKYSFDDPPR